MKIFIGSSNEYYPVAKEIKRDLSIKSSIPLEIVIWKEWFKRGDNYGLYTWDIITKAVDYFDCAIMLLAGDDKTVIREAEYLSTRDNVLIESGAFANSIGIDRVFLLIDKKDMYRKPSDYNGLNAIHFDYQRGAENPDAFSTMIEKIQQIEVANQVMISPDIGNYKSDNHNIIIKEKRGKIK